MPGHGIRARGSQDYERCRSICVCAVCKINFTWKCSGRERERETESERECCDYVCRYGVVMSYLYEREKVYLTWQG